MQLVEPPTGGQGGFPPTVGQGGFLFKYTTMKYLLYLLAAMLALTSCGDFYVLGSEPDPWDGISMKVSRNTAVVMEGDSMPLKVEFSPTDPSVTAVYWYSLDMNVATIKNDTMVATMSGDVGLVAISANGSLRDTCNVQVIERWNADRLEYSQPADMVIYADIQVDGQPWDDSTMMIAAFVREELAGMAVKRKAHGIEYTELRIWAVAEEDIGRVIFKCYDRRRFDLLLGEQEPEYDGFRTLGTISDLYSITFTSEAK